jgi:hypothetical protein
MRIALSPISTPSPIGHSYHPQSKVAPSPIEYSAIPNHVHPSCIHASSVMDVVRGIPGPGHCIRYLPHVPARHCELIGAPLEPDTYARTNAWSTRSTELLLLHTSTGQQSAQDHFAEGNSARVIGLDDTFVSCRSAPCKMA